ncbi:hypothetical protein [Thermococcus waiotapuensis]|uniref:Uncharacterized protein n=1 Tax=Thermococcus waiotapuensis TaxID=90909 RepID=A0AAE4NTV4_9EURY|nr:hypothetical protein [Thermococcus waiotapuensis]MDV3103754.1 hypothetical protein [Thermococcus waiotapuensis]
MGKVLGDILGFILLASASWWFWVGTGYRGYINFAIVIGYVLLLYAWTDYIQLIIHNPFGFAAMLGFFLGNIEGIFYAVPIELVFLLFASLMRLNREKAATLTFVASLPVALVNSYYYPIASPMAWALVGLMAAVIEHAAIEEMAEGDVFIIPLYFMALGPIAFIPLAFQSFTGTGLYLREDEDNHIEYYPVGPAMFVVSVPLFLMLGNLVESQSLPEWLFYAHFHGIKHPTLGLIGALAGSYLMPKVIYEMYQLEKDEKDSSTSRFTSAGAVMGLAVGVIAGLLSMVVLALIGVYFQNHGYIYLAYLFVFMAFGALFIGGFAVFFLFSELHYEGKSSINQALWLWGLTLVAILQSLFLLPAAWRAFPDGRAPAILTGLAVVSLFYLQAGKWENPTLIEWLWIATLLVSAFLAGVWAGFSLWWILYRAT